jgi:hypothetical protein
MDLAAYEVVIAGEFDPASASAFDDVSIERRPGRTVLSTADIDQAALNGLLDRLRMIGAVLISLHQIEPEIPRPG